MDTNTLIQSELTRIEEQATRETRLFLEAQDSFIAAHVLVELLKKHGADEDLHVTPLYHSHRAEMLLYPGDHSTETVAAIQAAGIEIVEVRRGYNDDVSKLLLRGYDNVEVFVRRNAMDWRAAA